MKLIKLTKNHQYDDIHNNQILNIIFIHGLQGDSCKTWGIQNNTSESLIARLYNLEKYTRINIYTYGYSTKDAPEGGIDTISENLYSNLSKLKGKHIIVAHSLGGIITKNTLNLNSKLIDSTIGVIFYGTPHQHPFDYATNYEALIILLICSIFLIKLGFLGLIFIFLLSIPFLPSLYFIKLLLFKSKKLENITTDFLFSPAKKIRIKCFYETKFSFYISKIVSPKAASMNKKCEGEACNSTHISLTKLSNLNSCIYKTLPSTIIDFCN